MSTQADEKILDSLDWAPRCGMNPGWHGPHGSGSAEWAVWMQSPCGQAAFVFSCDGCFKAVTNSNGNETTCRHCEKGFHEGLAKSWIKKAKYLR